MDKKTKTIAVVVVAVVVVCGLYFGINRWRQQRLVNQYLKGVYGLNTGMMGGLNSGGKIPDQVAKEIAKEMAKEEAKQQVDEAKEASKSPEDIYDDTKEMATYDANSKALADEVKKIMENAFGKVKLTSISTGLYGGVAGSGAVEFKLDHLLTGSDLGALSKAFADAGFQVIQSGIEDKSASLMAGNDAVSYVVGFEVEEQTVDVTVIRISQ